MALVTFSDKVQYEVNPLPDVNKLTADDVNHLKSVINANAALLGIAPFSALTGNASDNASLVAYLAAQITAALEGLKWKDAVQVATTANGTLASAFANGQTVDGIVLATGNRILIKNQTAQAENGIYLVNASGAPTRATDANSAAELEGAAVTVQRGDSNANTTWTQTTDGITLGSSNIVWAQFGSSVPDASGTTKGISKLYPSTSLGNNIDGAPDQNAVKIYVDNLTLPYTPPDELTQIAGLTLEADITTAQLLEALAIPFIIPIHAAAATSLVLTNHTNALQVLPLGTSNHYLRINTSNLRRMRLTARITVLSASANNPRLYIQYSINGGSTYVTLGAGTIASGDAISMFTGAPTIAVTNWINIPAEAKGDSFQWRVVTGGGDGAADPQLGNVYIEATT